MFDYAAAQFDPLDTLDKLSAAYLAGRVIEFRSKNQLTGAVLAWSSSGYSVVKNPVSRIAGDDAMRADFLAYDYRALIEKAPPILFDSDVSPAV